MIKVPSDATTKAHGIFACFQMIIFYIDLVSFLTIVYSDYAAYSMLIVRPSFLLILCKLLVISLHSYFRLQAVYARSFAKLKSDIVGNCPHESI